MTRTEEALAKLRELDEAASPGPWNENATGYIHSAEHWTILVAAKGSRHPIEDARLAAIGRNHSLRMMGALARLWTESDAIPPNERLLTEAEDVARATLTALEDAILGPEAGPCM